MSTLLIHLGLIIFGKEYNLWKYSPCSFPQAPVAPSFLGPNILLSPLFSNNLSSYSIKLWDSILDIGHKLLLLHPFCFIIHLLSEDAYSYTAEQSRWTKERCAWSEIIFSSPCKNQSETWRPSCSEVKSGGILPAANTVGFVPVPSNNGVALACPQERWTAGRRPVDACDPHPLTC